jgi:hypothetical protein
VGFGAVRPHRTDKAQARRTTRAKGFPKWQK